MATVYGVNATKANDPQAVNIVDPGLLGGKVRVYQDSYEAAALASGSKIYMGKSLPVGAQVLSIIFGHDALGAGVTVSVGDVASATRYLPATVCTAAGLVFTPNDVDCQNYAVTGTNDTNIVLTTGVGASTGTIKVTILYSVE